MTEANPQEWHIGVIGGSGLAGGIELDEAQDIEVASTFGIPSGPVRTGKLEGKRFTFIARHGEGHAIPPGEVNYRANIDVLKRCGVTDVLALSAIGSLREELAPGEFVAVDQFIDRTQGRGNSFFSAGVVAHVSLADPVCSRLAGFAAGAVRKAGGTVHEGGCYVAIEGPQFSTRAESRMYREWGGDVIGMTAMPEARLAREAELPYALLGMVTDWDSWRDEEAGVEASQILEVIAANVALAHETLTAFAAALPARRKASPIDKALSHAVITDRAKWPPQLVAKLGAVAGRVLR
ncbi:MAG: S-methyl-5'-thioadenosine phosphorylase [Novosphingobium sp.]|nr:S-methyl-5'-thioadenosine phosphorylase [Novosphingobium sp.]